MMTQEEFMDVLAMKRAGMTYAEIAAATDPTPTDPTPTGPPPATMAPPALQMSLSDTTVTPGGTVTVTGTGFVPGETVTATLHSTPRPIGATTADGSGSVSFSFQILPDDAPGPHVVSLTGATSGTIEASLTITEPDALPATGQSMMPLVATAALVLLSGVVVATIGRRKA